jgi:hypothetical protein
MGTELAVIEPLALPDRRRPAQMPSLPEWVVSRLESVKDNWQNGSKVLTLPASMVLTEPQKGMLRQHIADLGQLIERNPETSADAEAETLVTVTKMLLVLPAQRSTEQGNEAKGEAYLAALDDIPPWAVQEAIRKWYRGEHGPKFDYRWSPVPADLRSLARFEEYKVRGRMLVLQRIVDAVPLLEFSEEHCANMRQRLSDLMHGLNSMSEEPAAAAAEEVA